MLTFVLLGIYIYTLTVINHVNLCAARTVYIHLQSLTMLTFVLLGIYIYIHLQLLTMLTFVLLGLYIYTYSY